MRPKDRVTWQMLGGRAAWPGVVALSLMGAAGCSTALRPLSPDYFSLHRRHLLAGDVEFIPCPAHQPEAEDWPNSERFEAFDNLHGELRIPATATCQFRLLDYTPGEQKELHLPDWSAQPDGPANYDWTAGSDEDEVRRWREAEEERERRGRLELQLKWAYRTSVGAMDARSNGLANVYTLTGAEQATPEDAWEFARDVCPQKAVRAGGDPALVVELLAESAEGVPFYLRDVNAAGLASAIPRPYSGAWYSGCVQGGLLSGQRLIVVSFNAPLPADWGYIQLAGVRTAQRAPLPFFPTKEELKLWQERPKKRAGDANAASDR